MFSFQSPHFVLRWRARLLYVRVEMPQQIFNVFVPTFAKAKPVIYTATNYRLKRPIPFARRSTTNNSCFLIKSLLSPSPVENDEAWTRPSAGFCTCRSHNRNFKYLPAL